MVFIDFVFILKKSPHTFKKDINNLCIKFKIINIKYLLFFKIRGNKLEYIWSYDLTTIFYF